jgi:hypothetical protein
LADDSLTSKNRVRNKCFLGPYPGDDKMLKLTLMSLAALGALTVSANDAAAQCACDGAVMQTSPAIVQSVEAFTPMTSTGEFGAADTQTYQRFSYSPSVITPTTIAPAIVEAQTSIVQPMLNGRIVTQQPQVQSYRRFSYQPSFQSRSSSNTTRKQPWQYPKTDPRRYRN